MNILSIDLDYFLNDVTYASGNDNVRQSSNKYFPWSSQKVRDFVQVRFQLSKTNRIPGKIVKNHHEAFYYWRELIENQLLKPPFNLIHVDAHFDMSYFPDGTWMYIVEKYINKPANERLYPELLTDYGEYAHFGCGNFMLFVLANGWLSNIDYYYHSNLDCFDFLPNITVLVNKEEREYKVGLSRVNGAQIASSNIYKECVSIEHEASVRCIYEHEIIHYEKIDYILVSESPKFTPVESDKLIAVFREFIIEETN